MAVREFFRLIEQYEKLKFLAYGLSAPFSTGLLGGGVSTRSITYTLLSWSYRSLRQLFG